MKLLVSSLFLSALFHSSRGEKVLVLGGLPRPSSTELLQLETTPNTCRSIPDLPGNQWVNPVAALLEDAVTVCGGTNNKACYSLAPGAEAWQPAGELDSVRENAAAVLAPDSTWWITGGSYRGEPTASTVVYRNGSVETGPELPFAMEKHCMTQVDDTTTFVAGVKRDVTPASKHAFLYDWTANTFEELPGLGVDLVTVALSCEHDLDEVVVISNYLGEDEVSSNVEIFDLATRTWSLGPRVPVGSAASAYVTLPIRDSDGYTPGFDIIGSNNAEDEDVSAVYVWTGFGHEWYQAEQRLKFARTNHAAVHVTEEFCVEEGSTEAPSGSTEDPGNSANSVCISGLLVLVISVVAQVL